MYFVLFETISVAIGSVFLKLYNFVWTWNTGIFLYDRFVILRNISTMRASMIFLYVT